jgi:hypothetical protein
MRKLFFLIMLIPFGLRASSDTLGIADKTVLQELYGVVTRTKSADDKVYRWAHRRILYQALGIDAANKNDSVFSSRIRLGWQQLQTLRISNDEEPPVYFKDVLRLALHHGYGALLLDAVRWKVDVNSFDTESHTTILNFLESEYRDGFDGNRLEWLREYKQVLLAGGAVYFSEIDFKMRNLAKKYERIRAPVDGLYPVQQKGKWGWVNSNNKIVIPIKYKAVRNFTGELFEVSDDGSVFYILRRRK